VTTFALVHGTSHREAPAERVSRRRHPVIAVQLPCNDVQTGAARMIDSGCARRETHARLGVEPVQLSSDRSPQLFRPDGLADVLETG